jgi:hypothetical protein
MAGCAAQQWLALALPGVHAPLQRNAGKGTIRQLQSSSKEWACMFCMESSCAELKEQLASTALTNSPAVCAAGPEPMMACGVVSGLCQLQNSGISFSINNTSQHMHKAMLHLYSLRVQPHCQLQAQQQLQEVWPFHDARRQNWCCNKPEASRHTEFWHADQLQQPQVWTVCGLLLPLLF